MPWGSAMTLAETRPRQINLSPVILAVHSWILPSGFCCYVYVVFSNSIGQMDNSGKEKEAMQLMADADKKVKSSGSFLGGMFGGWDSTAPHNSPLAIANLQQRSWHAAYFQADRYLWMTIICRYIQSANNAFQCGIMTVGDSEVVYRWWFIELSLKI